MADKGTISNLKSSIDILLNNGVGSKFITPQKDSNLLKDIVDTIFPVFGSATGTNNYLVSMSTTQTSLQQGKLLFITFLNSNTTSATLKIDELTTKEIRKGNNSVLSTGEIVVGNLYLLTYYSQTDNFRILNL